MLFIELHNEKGTSIYERIMTMLATWGLKWSGLSPNANSKTNQLNIPIF
jgi:hypothetical protein